MSYEAVSFLRYVPPWRWLVKANKETMIRRSMRQERIIGGLFAAVGLWVLISSIVEAL